MQSVSRRTGTRRSYVSPSGEAGRTSLHPEKKSRQLDLLRFGLFSHRAKDRPKEKPLINAQSETVHKKPTCKKAFAERRCLIVADGFYEWDKANRPKTTGVTSIGGKLPFCTVLSA
jgi:putative SOS response-associated peptidase YedK